MYLHSVRYSGFTINQPKTKRARTSNLQSNNNRQVAGDSDGDMEVDADSEVQHISVRHRTRVAKNAQDDAVVAKRKTLGFFPDLWVKLLNYTKACFRLHLAITDPFPTCEKALSDTGICIELITESIVAWEAQNHCLEAGIFSGWSNSSGAPLTILSRYLPQVRGWHGHCCKGCFHLRFPINT